MGKLSRLKSDNDEPLSKQMEERVDQEHEDRVKRIPIDKTNIVSTGCTLLDLNILGGRIRGGGICGGIMVEISGASASGKTALMMDIAAGVQAKGGEVRIADPEGRLDRDYASTFGCEIPKENYYRPNIVLDSKNDRGTVTEQGVEGIFMGWEPEDSTVINMFGCDSLAALSTAMEMEAGDKRGQRKAKELSEFCRKMARIVAIDHKLTVFTNQLRQGNSTPTGVATTTTPGGFAIPFYCSVRISSKQTKQITRTKKNEHGVSVSKEVGIETELKITKNSLDDPFRKCKMYLLFGEGINDVMGNLMWLKENLKLSRFDCLDKTYASIWDAVQYIEDQDLEGELRDWVIDEWEKNHSLFSRKTKTKKRF